MTTSSTSHNTKHTKCKYSIINFLKFCVVRFFRSVAYWQFTRLLWDFTGRSRHYPLPCCAYTKIRKQFPDENGQYHGFEDDDEETVDVTNKKQRLL